MKLARFLVSPVFMGILFIIFAASMAVATFVENDFGSSAAYNLVYDSHWFELLLLMLAINLAGQMVIFKLYRWSKLPVFLFHISFILILTGAAITRYTGWEGTIHIREGEEQNRCFSGETYIGYSIRDKSGTLLSGDTKKYSQSSASKGSYKQKIRLEDAEYKLILTDVIQNVIDIITESESGDPVIAAILSDSTVRESVILRNGDSLIFSGVSIGLNPDSKCNITILSDSASFTIVSDRPVDITDMVMQETKSIKPGEYSIINPMNVVKMQGFNIVFRDIQLKGTVKTVPVAMNTEKTGKNAFQFNLLKDNNVITAIQLLDDEDEYQTFGYAFFDDKEIEVKYGHEDALLPFTIHLNDFVLDRYPGSNSPSGYKSDVILIDKASGIDKTFSIFMNNILKYKGYRLYQSSYDPDEKGTILSVNHDPAGIFITYCGYCLLFLFIIISLLNRGSTYYKVNAGYWNSAFRKRLSVIILLLLVPSVKNLYSQNLITSKESAEEFGKVLVQDQKGRTKPLFTLSSDILRKISGGNKFEDLTPMQVFLGIHFDFDNWKDVALIKISGNELRNSLGLNSNKAAFTDLVTLEGRGSYKLSDRINEVYAKAPGTRTKADKEIMKVDERVNILYMIYTGEFMKIFPLHDNSHDWASPDIALSKAVGKEDSVYIENIMSLMADALQTGNNVKVAQISRSIKEYQERFSMYDLPSEKKLGAEMLYYKLMIFERLFPVYSLIGLIMLTGLMITVIRSRKNITLLTKILTWILLGAFILHTFGLGVRWYISGHSPMSNGYESMIFISWVTLLAGFIFRKRSPFALSATAILAGLTLMVAHLSFMDPEITNLVPVLKSYWLTLHVSVITGSYGFLGLGAVFGIISMILISLSGKNNYERISSTLDDLTVINFKTLTIGLYLLTIGTFLGAIWANESWGRYWGWDPKETWSLITIIVYGFVVHSRLIPGMKDIYTFNILSLYAFSSVLMTYFGVNYYLSGLHSYAGGDPVPIPLFVYISLIILVSLSVMAYIRYRRLNVDKDI
jgi:cytochrome c-type biogenesis protein CcsB